MYQKREKNPSNEAQFNSILEAFNENIFPLEDIDSNFDKWELESKFYTPNHACIWNRPDYIDEKCIIIEKNDKLALVVFEKDKYALRNELVLKNLYRLEDLSLI